MKPLASCLSLALALSIYDLPHDPQKVVVEAVKDDGQTVRVVIPKADLDADTTIEKLTEILSN